MRKAKAIMLSMTPEEFEHWKGFQDRHNYMSFSEMVRHLLREGAKKIEPPYVKVRLDNPRLSPEEKARQKVEVKDYTKLIEEEKEREEGITICTALNGELIDRGDGRLVCEYKLYELIGNRVDESILTESLRLLDPETIKRQYKDVNGNTGPEVKEKILAILSQKNEPQNAQ